MQNKYDWAVTYSWFSWSNNSVRAFFCTEQDSVFEVWPTPVLDISESDKASSERVFSTYALLEAKPPGRVRKSEPVLCETLWLSSPEDFITFDEFESCVISEEILALRTVLSFKMKPDPWTNVSFSMLDILSTIRLHFCSS